MKRPQPHGAYLKIPAILALTFLLVAGGAGSAWAGSWVKVAVGMSGMGMDDINNQNFSFYEFTPDGFDLPDLKSGFSLSFHLGYDLSRDFSLGFSWDHQYARVSGTDEDVTGHLNVDANFFMGHLYWRPLRTEKWEFGAAAGLGLVLPSGQVRVTGSNNVNYGQDDLTGSSSLALEFMALVDFSLSNRSAIEVTAGWRDATIKEFRVAGATVLKEDGTNMELDYTGFIVKAGFKYMFGEKG